MATRYMLARSGAGMLLVTLEKMGTRPMGSTMMKRATVARTRPTVGSGLISLPLYWWWAGRDLNPRPSPCEGDVRSVHSTHTRLDYRPRKRDARIDYFIFQDGGLSLSRYQYRPPGGLEIHGYCFMSLFLGTVCDTGFDNRI